MHATERDELILQALTSHGFISLQDLCTRLNASPATIRRDLERLEKDGELKRVRGGARAANGHGDKLAGAPFALNQLRQVEQKAAIGLAASKLCDPGESVIIDGGTTTFAMCEHLDGLGLQVLSNSLHVVDALLPQHTTRVSVPGGAIFREQNIILSPFDDDGLGSYHASKMFMGAAALGPKGLMQADVVLVQAERKLMELADQLIVLVDSSKFRTSATFVLCGLERINVVVTDANVRPQDVAMLEAQGIEVAIAGS